HRDQHQLPEEIEEKEVQGEEDPHDARLHRQQKQVVQGDPLMDRTPGSQHGDHRHQRGQDHQQQADPVHAKGIADAQRLDPGQVLEEEKAFRSCRRENRVLTEPGAASQHRFDEGNGESHDSGQAFPLSYNKQKERPDQRQKQQERKERGLVHSVTQANHPTSSAAPAAMPSSERETRPCPTPPSRTPHRPKSCARRSSESSIHPSSSRCQRRSDSHTYGRTNSRSYSLSTRHPSSRNAVRPLAGCSAATSRSWRREPP